MIHKYVRTPHIKGSRKSKGDDLNDISMSDLKGKHLVIEEKVDGANAGISFEDGALKLQSRGHYLTGGPREKHFDLLKVWATTHALSFQELLGEDYVLYGEWLWAKHTCYYDMLPHYFMEFDIMNKKTGEFLSTVARNDMITRANMRNVICSVRVIEEGQYSNIKQLQDLIGKSAFKSEFAPLSLEATALESGVDPAHARKHTDMSDDMEGLYIKWEEDGLVKGRYKFVRESFTNSILEQDEHWLNRKIICNMLTQDAYEKMFAPND